QHLAANGPVPRTGGLVWKVKCLPFTGSNPVGAIS
ncbi:MAG: hypothetical protein JWM77_2827, partial [Rhodospirillales bacterium]|nr:hypothetical protein [Rhodospirillales bacterium]